MFVDVCTQPSLANFYSRNFTNRSLTMKTFILLGFFCFSLLSAVALAQPNYSTLTLNIVYDPGKFTQESDKDNHHIIAGHWSTFTVKDYSSLYLYTSAMTRPYKVTLLTSQYTMEGDKWGLIDKSKCSFFGGCITGFLTMNLHQSDGNVTLKVNRVGAHSYNFTVETDSHISRSGRFDD